MSVTKYRYLVFIFCILILLVSSIPGKPITTFKLGGLDKLLHFLEYFLLGWLLIHSLKERKLRFILMMVIGGMIFGAFDETWQRFVSDRSSSILDWIADAIGVSSGSIFGLVMIKRRSSPISNHLSNG